MGDRPFRLLSQVRVAVLSVALRLATQQTSDNCQQATRTGIGVDESTTTRTELPEPQRISSE